jgi:hypothetical protein
MAQGRAVAERQQRGRLVPVLDIDAVQHVDAAVLR